MPDQEIPRKIGYKLFGIRLRCVGGGHIGGLVAEPAVGGGQVRLAGGVAQGHPQDATTPGGHRDVGVGAAQLGVMFVRRHVGGQGVGIPHRRADQAVAPQRLFQAVPEHGVATEAVWDDVVGDVIAQQQHPLLDVIDGATAVGQDEAGPEEEVMSRRTAVLLGRGDTHAAEADPGEFLRRRQRAAQGESLGHGLGKQLGVPAQEVVHEDSHGLGVVPDAVIGGAVQG
jgi:hypothetical protein